MDAISKGFEQKLMWGVEASGPNRSYRVLQKRGKICDGDDFGEVKTTYPAHPSSVFVPMHTNFQDLKQKRHLEDKVKLEKCKQEWDKRHPSSVSRPYILSEYFVDNPKHKTMSEIKSELKRQAREKANLKPMGDFSVDEKPAPTLKYIATPSAYCKQALIEK